ncbi:MAG: translation initiation factor IF-3 [Alphaproteobacteria bacterium]|nr:translation initiation factor IF-3 [Alphaproteobacteria bacterium]MCK5517973.1 translation initiation factor IF-3 [Alphaproteobacteria bacterium]MCK5555704.1 translation initiation factor IF-3 [Alphaproteobacteria bacterium]MCK5659455.1 translation initiation factor IF-3 [Alphaproteobacteria bacterium]
MRQSVKSVSNRLLHNEGRFFYFNNSQESNIAHKPLNRGPCVNTQIRSDKVRLIGADGEMVGVVPINEALSTASEAGLDLIEISPNADPPVCKISDYGRYRYDLQKKEAAARKNQKIVLTKELKIRPNIEDHDFQVKVRSAKRFLDDGDKVRFTLQFRGREFEHRELGLAVLHRMRDELVDYARIEQEPKFEGGQVVMFVVPKIV